MEEIVATRRETKAHFQDMWETGKALRSWTGARGWYTVPFENALAQLQTGNKILLADVLNQPSASDFYVVFLRNDN